MAPHSSRRLATLAATASGLLLLASPAFAHPSFNPNQVTAGEQFEVDLVIPHGCAAGGGMPSEGEEASPTIRIDLQVPDTAHVVEVAEHRGWKVTQDTDAITWSDDGGATNEPLVFPLSLEIDSGFTEDTTLYWTILQTCQEGSTLWIAQGEDGEASPAAVMLVAAGVGGVDQVDEDPEGGDATAPAPVDEHDAADATGIPAGAEETDDGYGFLVLFTLVMVVLGVVGILRMDESATD